MARDTQAALITIYFLCMLYDLVRDVLAAFGIHVTFSLHNLFG